MKKSYKIYLDEADYKKLKQKAEGLFGEERGAVGSYIRKVSNEPIVFLDSNTKLLLDALKVRA